MLQILASPFLQISTIKTWALLSRLCLICLQGKDKWIGHLILTTYRVINLIFKRFTINRRFAELPSYEEQSQDLMLKSTIFFFSFLHLRLLSDFTIFFLVKFFLPTYIPCHLHYVHASYLLCNWHSQLQLLQTLISIHQGNAARDQTMDLLLSLDQLILCYSSTKCRDVILSERFVCVCASVCLWTNSDYTATSIYFFCTFEWLQIEI